MLKNCRKRTILRPARIRFALSAGTLVNCNAGTNPLFVHNTLGGQMGYGDLL